MRHLFFIITVIAVGLLGCLQSLTVAASYDGVLQKPIVLGAWLFDGNCVRCHAGNDGEYLAEDYSTRKELKSALSGNGCEINWSRRDGGPMDGDELDALALFLMRWSEDGEYPDVGSLPEQPKGEVAAAGQKNEKQMAAEGDLVDENTLDPVLQKLIETNPLSQGGYLYTQNCYRCHLSYKKARMGKGIEREIVLRTITEGKTSTQMKAFSRMLGGELKNSEIENIANYVMTWEKLQDDPAIAAELMVPPAFDPVMFKPVRLARFKEVEGNPAQGKKLFAKNCFSCHGTNGEGLVGPSLQRMYSLRTDLYTKSVLKNGVPGSIMKSWSQSNGGLFTAKDLDDTVSFVVGLNR